MIVMMLGMGQQEIAIIFIVFLFLMVFLPVFTTIIARVIRAPREDEPRSPRRSDRS